MSTILIQEPYPEIRELIRRVVERLGHEAIFEDEARQDPERIDAVVLEPAMIRGVELMAMLREINPRLPLVTESVDVLEPFVEAMKPVAHLLKPFTLTQLSAAIELALEGVPAAV